MKNLNLINAGMLILLFTIAGCGGGGNSVPASTSTAITQTEGTVSKQIAVKFSTSGSIANNTIKGLQFEINLPTGVSVQSDSNGLLSSYLQTSGVALTATSPYISGRASGSKISVNFVNANGISTGEFATLTCNLATGTAMPATDSFSVDSGYKVTDIVSGSGTVSLSNLVTIKISSVTAK